MNESIKGHAKMVEEEKKIKIFDIKDYNNKI